MKPTMPSDIGQQQLCDLAYNAGVTDYNSLSHTINNFNSWYEMYVPKELRVIESASNGTIRYVPCEDVLGVCKRLDVANQPCRLYKLLHNCYSNGWDDASAAAAEKANSTDSSQLLLLGTVAVAVGLGALYMWKR